MSARLVALRLNDIVEAIHRIREAMGDATLEAFEADWKQQWLVERGTEIVSEASRHLPPDMKARHPEIPWRRVAGIGNVTRHDYRNIAPDVLWAMVQNDLAPLDHACRAELAALP